MNIKYTVKFFLNKKFEKEGKYKIYGRILYKRKKSEFATNLWLESEKWNQELQVAIKAPVVTRQLNLALAGIQETVSHLYYEKKYIDAKSIKDYYVGNEVLDIGIIEYIRKVAEQKVKTQSKTTVQKYVLLSEKMSSYINERYKVKEINIKKVDYMFIIGFDKFLRNIITKQYNKPMEQSTINKTHGFFSAVLNQAFEEEYINRQPYKRFKFKSVDTKIKYLSKEEIERIEKLDLSDNKPLDVVRDTFIFSVYTGLRYSDTQLIRMSDLSYEEGIPISFYLDKQKKTRNKVELPLFPKVVSIINKYNNTPDRFIDERLLPKRSNDKINKGLKIIGNMANISFPLTHKSARHSLATTILLENGVQLLEVKEWLGHSDYRSSMVYAQVTNTQKRKTLDRLVA